MITVRYVHMWMFAAKCYVMQTVALSSFVWLIYVVCCLAKFSVLFIFYAFKGGPTIEQRFDSYYSYCGLFNYILSEWLLLLIQR